MQVNTRADNLQNHQKLERESGPASRWWNWVRDETTKERTLYLNGVISDETWWGDEVTPKLFRDELFAGSGDVTVWINSPGGDVFAAAQIYNMLMDYTGKITVKIDGLAASAASVIAMAGGDVYMSPVSMLMIHNPSTVAIGDSEEMLRAKALLDEVKESIINAYELKSGLSRAKISHLMDAETWMNANKAIELGFADKILFVESEPAPADAMIFSRMAVTSSLQTALDSFCRKRQKLARSVATPLPMESCDSTGTPELINRLPKAPKPKTGTPIEALEKRLSLITH
jgi:ATP-dependent Clp protease protease subunit